MPKVINFTLDKIMIPLKTIIAHPWFRTWCAIPHKNNPEGCRNCEKCETEYSDFEDFFDFNAYERTHDYRIDSKSPDIFLIIRPFNLEGWSNAMKKENMYMSYAQTRNSRYWQGGLMGTLRRDCKEFCEEHINYITLEIPEATGVNLFATCRHHEFTLKKNPKYVVNKMMMVGLKTGSKLSSLLRFFE